jgi:hypothetical protein
MESPVVEEKKEEKQQEEKKVDEKRVVPNVVWKNLKCDLVCSFSDIRLIPNSAPKKGIQTPLFLSSSPRSYGFHRTPSYVLKNL